MNVVRRYGLLLVLSCALVACRETEVYSDLTQAEANEIVVLLAQESLPATIVKTVKQNVPSFGVSVAAADVERARGLLQSHNLPRPEQPGLKDIFKEAGFIPTPQEQKARMLLALKGEIINSLQKIPDVIEADVLINVPTPGENNPDVPQQKPSASVVLKVRPTEQSLATLTEVKIQNFVSNAVEQLDPRNVTVIVSYVGGMPAGVTGPNQTVITKAASAAESLAETDGSADNLVTFAGLAVQSDSVARLKWYLGGFLGVLALVSLGLVVMVLRTSRMRQMQEGDHALLPDNDFPPQLHAGGE